MSDKTPNSLEPTGKFKVTRMSRWPLFAVMLAGLFLLGVLVYSVNFAHNQQQEETAAKKVDIKEEEKPLLMGEGRGLALAPPAALRPLRCRTQRRQIKKNRSLWCRASRNKQTCTGRNWKTCAA